MKILHSYNVNSKIVLPDDRSVPLSDIFDPEKVTAFINREFSYDFHHEHFKISYIRYSPKKSCLVCCRYVDGDKRDFKRFYVRLMNDDIFAAVKKSLVRKSEYSKDFTLLEEPKVLICRFPFDEKLVLSPIIDNTKTAEYKIVRYKPETRFVVQCENFQFDSQSYQGVYARIELPEKVQNSYENTLKVSAALSGDGKLATPKILSYSKADALLLQQKVPGVVLAKSHLKPESSELKAAASILSIFHNLKLDNVQTQDSRHYMSRFMRLERILSSLDNDVRNKLDEVSYNLDSLHQNMHNENRVIIHGDFHQGQIILGEKLNWILDLDGIALASPAVDLGNFYAQLIKMDIKRSTSMSDDIFGVFLEAYKSQTNIKMNNNEIKYYTSISLVELAVKELRRLREDWYIKIMYLLDESLKVMR